MEPTLRSGTIRTLIHCPVCEKPIGERLGNQWWFMNKNGHTISKIAVIMNQNTPTGSYTVKCPDEKCDGGHIFTWINETVGITEEIEVKVAS